MQSPPKTYKRKRRSSGAGMKNTGGSRATTVMKAMSNSQRLEILSHLINREELSVKELENILQSLSQSALSQHLARLRRAQIVKARRSSQMVFYSIEDSNVEIIIKLLSTIYEDDPVLHKTP